MTPHSTFELLCPECGSPELGEVRGDFVSLTCPCRLCNNCGWSGFTDELVADAAASGLQVSV